MVGRSISGLEYLMLNMSPFRATRQGAESTLVSPGGQASMPGLSVPVTHGDRERPPKACGEATAGLTPAQGTSHPQPHLSYSPCCITVKYWTVTAEQVKQTVSEDLAEEIHNI